MHVRAIAFLAVSLVACSSSSTPANKPPVIDAFDAPATATGTGGVYSLTGMFTVHDDDDTVTQFRVRADGLADSPPDTLPTPMMRGTYRLTLQFPGMPGKMLNYHLTVLDSRGAESAPIDKTVTLQ